MSLTTYQGQLPTAAWHHEFSHVTRRDLLTCDFYQMYSLGIMFFEMCYPPMLGMQRAQVLEDLRRPHPVLPSDFDPGAAQAEIIMSLLTHNPKERPSSTELLKSNKLPDEMESDTIRRAMSVSTPPSQYLVLFALFRAEA